MRARVLLAGFLLAGVASAGAASVLETDKFRLDLYASFEMEYQLEDRGNGDPNGSFDADQIDLLFNVVQDKLSLSIDVAIEHGVATEDDRGNVVLSHGFAEYALSDAVRLRAGKYLSPFGITNQYNSLKSAFLPVKLPLSTEKPNKLTGNGYRFFPRRQVGLAALGVLTVGDDSLEYDVVLSNGEQEETNPFEEDDNSQKAMTARLLYRRGLTLRFGGSAYIDTLASAGGNVRLQSLGLQFAHEGDRFRFQSEVVTGELDYPGGKAADVDQLGGYAEIGYRVGKHLTPFAQFQYVSTETIDLDESATVTIVGINARIQANLILKLENAYFKGSERNSEFSEIPGGHYNELRAAIVLGF